MAFNFDSCLSLAASKSYIFASTASNSVTGVLVHCFALELVSLADIRLSTILIYSKGYHADIVKLLKVIFLKVSWRELRAVPLLAWRHHMTFPY